MPDNRKKSSKSKKKDNSTFVFIISFVFTFMIATGIIGICLNYFSPTVDVNIGQNDVLPEDNEQIPVLDMDNRLKWIQDEDNYAQQPTSEKYLQLDKEFNSLNADKTNNIKKENIRPVKNTESKSVKKERQDNIPVPVHSKDIEPPVPTLTEVQNTVNKTPSEIKITKVYTGFYKSAEEAQQAKEKIANLFPELQPFVKSVNGQYIVQAGSFSSRKKAVELRESLNSRGYTAKLLSN